MDLRLDAFVVSFALVATVAAAQDEATPTDASSEPQHFGEEIVVTGSPTSAAPNVDCLQAVCAGQARTRPRLECDPYRAGRPRVKCRVRSRCAVTRAVTDALSIARRLIVVVEEHSGAPRTVHICSGRRLAEHGRRRAGPQGTGRAVLTSK